MRREAIIEIKNFQIIIRDFSKDMTRNIFKYFGSLTDCDQDLSGIWHKKVLIIILKYSA